MRVVLDRDGKKETAEVASDFTSVTVNGRSYPVVVVSSGVNRIELEIDGERAVVENWPEHFPTPYGPVDVNGERWSVKAVVESADLPARGSAAPTPPRAPPAGSAPASATSATPGEGIPVVPAMPGRVIEVRVAEGDRVKKGQTLLILEAMKMRGEVNSPADGIVVDLKVAAGANARAKEPMMRIRPASSGG